MIQKISRVAIIICVIVLVCIPSVAAYGAPTVIVQTSSDTPGVTTVIIIEPTPTQAAPTMSAEEWAEIRAAHQDHWEATHPQTPIPIFGMIAGLGISGLLLMRKN